MWTYYQTGDLVGPDDIHAEAYSGKGAHKNRPESQSLQSLGPIPCGIYFIGAPYDSEKHGPFTLRLIPRTNNVMFGRAGFLIHGDSIAEPGSASDGCIVAARAVRERIYKSGDKLLEVKARPEMVAVDPGMENE